MKKLIIFTLLTLNFNAFVQCQNIQKNEVLVGVDDGNSTIKIDANFLKQWESILKTQNESFSKLSTEFELYENTESKSYILIGTTDDKMIKSAVELKKEEANYYFISERGTVSCSGCTVGCDPKKSGKNWICTNCSGDFKKCNKTVTVDTLTDSED